MKQNLFNVIRMYYNREWQLHGEGMIADNWLDGCLFVLKELEILNDKEIKTWREKIIKGERI